MKKAIFSLMVALLLGGCAVTAEEGVTLCPAMGLLRDADKIVFFKDETGKELALTVALANFYGGCSLSRNNQMIYSLSLDFAALRAEGRTEKRVEIPYFIAILSPTEEVLQRAQFSTIIEIDNAGKGVSTEEHELKIPMPDPATAARYEITAGFILTPDQLEANRSKK